MFPNHISYVARRRRQLRRTYTSKDYLHGMRFPLVIHYMVASSCSAQSCARRHTLAPALRRHRAKRCVKTHGVVRVEEELTLMHRFSAHSSSPRQVLFSSSIKVSVAESSKKEQLLVFGSGDDYTGCEVIPCN